MDGLNIGGKALKLKTKKKKLKKKRPLSNILPLNLYYIDIYSIQRLKNKPKTSCLTCFEMFVSATRLCVTYCKKTIVLPEHTNTNCQWSIALLHPSHSPHPVLVCLSPSLSLICSVGFNDGSLNEGLISLSVHIQVCRGCSGTTDQHGKRPHA